MDAFDGIVEDHLRRRLGSAADLGQVRADIWRRFVEGVANRCGLLATGFLERGLRAARLTQGELADFLGTDRTVLNRALNRRVELSYRTLALALTALNQNLADVDFPSRDERLTAGFLYAVPYVRGHVLRDPCPELDGEPFTRETLGELERMFGDVPASAVVTERWGVAWCVCLWAFHPVLNKGLRAAVRAAGTAEEEP